MAKQSPRASSATSHLQVDSCLTTVLFVPQGDPCQSWQCPFKQATQTKGQGHLD